jgi:iron(II)-dependent oxidoreductase
MRPPPLTSREIVDAMRAFRARTIGLIVDLDDAQMIGPRLATVNPPLWEIGHIAWFQEFWVLRHLKKRRPRSANADRLYNSTDIAHETRWELLLPSRAETLDYMAAVLDDCLELAEGPRELSSEEQYFLLLTLFHEGMHAEALAYTRQTLAYPRPSFVQPQPAAKAEEESCSGDVEVPGGTFIIGATPEFSFVFDNEKWSHEVTVKPFRIARTAVTNGDYLRFVEADGYREKKFWSPAGWRWLQSGGAPMLEQSFRKFFDKQLAAPGMCEEPTEIFGHPRYWRRSPDGVWQQRVFDRFVLLDKNLPIVHVTWYEAEAYCNWAGRRLPSEVEWEVAAAGQRPSQARRPSPDQRRYYPWGDEPPSRERANLDWRADGPVAVNEYSSGDSAFGCRQMIGNVWEWTADDFRPYPGFSADPYKEYSMPWFGTHKVLRGGCWVTSSLLIRNTWRNFYTPDRGDVWAGFRTCAL